jgi:hypothetical protein
MTQDEIDTMWQQAMRQEKAIAELESQNIKQVTVKDFVHMVEGREDLIGRPVYFAQWPNGNTHPPQRTWVGLTEEQRNDIEDSFGVVVSKHVFDAIEAKLKEKNSA